jgi:hypothetical protein
MQPKSDKHHVTPLPKNPLRSQMIVSAAALAIIVLGGWSMFQAKSPYHPDGFSEDVTRSGPSGLSVIMSND